MIAGEPLNGTDLRIAAYIVSLRSPLLDPPMVLATYLCSWQIVVAGTALVTLGLASRRKWLQIGTLLVSVIGDEIIVATLKTMLHRARPDQTIALLPAPGLSFPSGHTVVALAFYGVLAFFLIDATSSRRLQYLIGIVALAGIATVGFSRVYVGAHWPSDVLASFTMGTTWLAVVTTGFLKLRRSTASRVPSAWTFWMRVTVGALFGCWLATVITFYALNPPADGAGWIVRAPSLLN